jgi:protein-L-isoaspartate(D-aspartate) O-methyltransferase
LKYNPRGIGMTSERTRARLVEKLRGSGIRDARVLAAMHAVPRHLFVEEALASRAYDDVTLPIGFSQTISRPQTVALATQTLVEGRTPRRVLEVGTGCGYQAAVLARIAGEVYTLERIHELHVRAREALFGLDIRNVRCRFADGNHGWPEHAPYDGILLSAAPPEIPEMLLAQLAVRGRLVAPVGVDQNQRLQVVTRTDNGYERREASGAHFVPMCGGVS